MKRTDDRVRVLLAFYNYRGVMTELTPIAEFRCFNWAKEFIPNAQKWIESVGCNEFSKGGDKILVEIWDKELNAPRILTREELKERLEKEDE